MPYHYEEKNKYPHQVIFIYPYTEYHSEWKLLHKPTGYLFDIADKNYNRIPPTLSNIDFSDIIISNVQVMFCTNKKWYIKSDSKFNFKKPIELIYEDFEMVYYKDKSINLAGHKKLRESLNFLNKNFGGRNQYWTHSSRCRWIRSEQKKYCVSKRKIKWNTIELNFHCDEAAWFGFKDKNEALKFKLSFGIS